LVRSGSSSCRFLHHSPLDAAALEKSRNACAPHAFCRAALSEAT
jgi:hypothetical protein